MRRKTIEKMVSNNALSKEEIGNIADAIHHYFNHILWQTEDDNFTIPYHLLAKWKESGTIAYDVIWLDFATPSFKSGALIVNPFVLERMQPALDKGGSYEDVFNVAINRPLVKPVTHAIKIIEEQLVDYLSPFEITDNSTIETIKKMAIYYHAKTLQKSGHNRDGIIRYVVDIRGLESELGHALGWGLVDWYLLAQYIVYDASAQGALLDIIERRGPATLVYKMPLPTECDVCKNLYLEPNGVPKLFRADAMLAWKNNILHNPLSAFVDEDIDEDLDDGTFLKIEDVPNLKPVAGLVHSYCQCQGPYLFTGMEAWADTFLE